MTQVTICYGMTETSPVATQTRSDDSIDHRVSTVGTVLAHLDVKVVDSQTGRTVPRYEVGEICIRGYSVLLGCWEQPQVTAQVIAAARWMHTGDRGVPLHPP